MLRGPGGISSRVVWGPPPPHTHTPTPLPPKRHDCILFKDRELAMMFGILLKLTTHFTHEYYCKQ